MRELAKVTGAKKTYASCEEMFEKDKEIEAVFIAMTRRVMRVLHRGAEARSHMASAVPAILGQDQRNWPKSCADRQEDSEDLRDVRDLLVPRGQLRHAPDPKAGGFGKLVYSEGEYYHYSGPGHEVPSYKDWRKGLPPHYYPTHSSAYYTCVDAGLVHVGDLPWDEESPRRVPADRERLQKSVRYGDRAFPHERGRNVAHGRRVGHARCERMRRDASTARRARSMGGITVSRTFQKSIKRSGSCRREWTRAATVVHTDT
jgi:hypothetical protein